VAREGCRVGGPGCRLPPPRPLRRRAGSAVAGRVMWLYPLAWGGSGVRYRVGR